MDLDTAGGVGVKGRRPTSIGTSRGQVHEVWGLQARTGQAFCKTLASSQQPQLTTHQGARKPRIYGI